MQGGNSLSVASAIFDGCYFMSLDCNQVDYELARLAWYNPPNLWLDDAPEAVIPMLVSDATILVNE